MADTLEIVVDVLGRPPTANARQHWAAKARDTKAWRDAACMIARGNHYGNRMLSPVAITAHARYRHNKLTDPENIAPTVKAAVDGLRDARVIPDDTAEHVRSVQLLPPVHDPSRPDALILTVTAL